MTEKVIWRLDELAAIIHTPEGVGFENGYLAFIDSIIEFLEEMQKAGYSVDLMKELTEIQDIMDKEDRVMLSDFLLYTLKPQFKEIKIK